MNYKIVEAAFVGEVAPVFFRSFRDAFRSFGWPLPFLGLVPFFFRLAAYGLIVLVVILLLRDRRSTPSAEREEHENSRSSHHTTSEMDRDDAGEVEREEAREEGEIERLRGKIARLEERLSRLEDEEPE